MTDVQQQVEDLAAALDCPVLVEDGQHRPLWWSAQGEVDDVRSRTILQRSAPPAAAALVTTLGLANAEGPVRTPAVAHVGMSERWCVPLRANRELLGYLWVLDASGKVGESDLAPVIECARVATLALQRLRPSPEVQQRRRTALLGRLCAGPDPDALEDLLDLEGLPAGAAVAVDSPGSSGGWPLPDGSSAHVSSAPVQPSARARTSGAPLPLGRLSEAVQRATVTRRALRAGAVLAQPSWSHLGLWHLVVSAPAQLEPRDIHPGVDALLAPRRADLLGTARRVLDNGGDVTLSAEQLHVHRTTLYYRLDRIEKLTGVNLRLAAGRDDMHLALLLAAYRAAAAD